MTETEPVSERKIVPMLLHNHQGSRPFQYVPTWETIQASARLEEMYSEVTPATDAIRVNLKLQPESFRLLETLWSQTLSAGGSFGKTEAPDLLPVQVGASDPPLGALLTEVLAVAVHFDLKELIEYLLQRLPVSTVPEDHSGPYAAFRDRYL